MHAYARREAAGHGQRGCGLRKQLVGAAGFEAGGVGDEPFCLLDNSPEAQARLSAQMDALGDGRSLPVIDEERGEEGKMGATVAPGGYNNGD
ncbi:MAG TPA: hypothetical protein PK696_04020 [bacterium]|nr:hypothetical protein [bacterium]